VPTYREPDVELYPLHIGNPTCRQYNVYYMLGNQLQLALSDGHYSPGCTVYLEAWHHRNGVVDLLLEKKCFYHFTVTVRVSRVTGSGLGLGLFL